MNDDADLMRRIAAGESDAFRTLVGRYERMGYSFFLRLTGSPEDAEDLTQDLFVAIFRSAARYRADAPFKTYFYRIASNVSASHLRKRKLRAAPSIDEMCERGFDVATTRHEDDPALSLDGREMRRRYEEALVDLPRDWRIALELRVTGELTYEEIAGAMGKSVSAVESILVRARERIAEKLDEQ